MMIKRFLAAMALTASIAATSLSASAQGWPINPPPPRYEHHGYRAGYIWESGHWAWRAHRWVWVAGFWVRVRCGAHWVPGHWRYGPGGSIWVPGHCR